MKKYIICIMIGGFLLLFGMSKFIFAQITLAKDDAPSELGDYFVMGTADTVSVNLGEPGANKYWDFSNIPLTGEDYWRVVDFGSSPFANRFPTGNLAYQVTEYIQDTTLITYNYVRLTETELTQLGLGKYKIVGSDTTINQLIVSKRSKPQLNLPVNYGDQEWASVIEFDTVYIGLQATVIDSNHNQIDAWGTIKTHFGEFPCLRIRQDHSTFAIPALFPGLKYPLEINVVYYWVTNDYGIIATVTGMSDAANPNPDPNFSTAKSVNIMTNFLTSVRNTAQVENPRDFELFQNYPNPFNPSTTIRYQLNEPAEVRLRVFNLAGQEVALFVRAKQEPGSHEIEWNAGELPSGIYYYQVQANNNILTRKSLLLK